jgi:hypothetical protein
MEGGAALHLDRRTRPMGEHERRRVERRVGAPPALPVNVVLPAGRTELIRTHDLGADTSPPLLGKRVIGTGAATGASQHRGTEPGGEHPLRQPSAGVTHGRVRALALTGAETVQRDEQVVYPCACHIAAVCLLMSFLPCEPSTSGSSIETRREHRSRMVK